MQTSQTTGQGSSVAKVAESEAEIHGSRTRQYTARNRAAVGTGEKGLRWCAPGVAGKYPGIIDR